MERRFNSSFDNLSRFPFDKSGGDNIGQPSDEKTKAAEDIFPLVPRRLIDLDLGAARTRGRVRLRQNRCSQKAR